MAGLQSLNEIFNHRIFRIPDYQRGFAWTEVQLKDFWDDLYNLNDAKHHYTGVLTVKEVPPIVCKSENWIDEHWLLWERGFKAFYVVDGQQRLTTSIILIQAAIEVIWSENENNKLPESDVYLGSFSIKDIREAYLVMKQPPQNIIKTYKFGYESDNPSFKFLRHRIFNEPNGGTIDETFYTLNLENAKRFFIEKIKGVYALEGEEGVQKLFKKLTVNFKFNFYELEEDFDVFVAFETMNNRGKKLSNLELLKNRLIFLTTLYDPEELKEDAQISLRRSIDDAWKEIYHQLGRNKHHPLNDDDFLIAHWIIYFQYTRKKGNDYINFLLNDQFSPRNIFTKREIPVNGLETFEVVVESDTEDEEENQEQREETTHSGSKLKPEEIEAYVKSLKSAAVHWYNTHNPINNESLVPQEQEWLDRLNRIGIAYFRPLVTASFLVDDITTAQRVKLFEKIERFIFVAFRVGRSSSSYRNSEFFKASRLLRIKEWNVDQVCSILDERISTWFYENEQGKFWDISDFKKYIDKKYKNGLCLGFYSWNGLRYLLYEYEMAFVKQRGSKKIDWLMFVKNDTDMVSIEHVLPQTPSEKCWKPVLKGCSDNQQTILKGTLGNLVPLSRSINSSLQNDCFADKKIAKFDANGRKTRQGYHDGSHSEIEISQLNEWTKKEILDRGIKLLKFVEERWGLKFENERKMVELLGLDFLLPKSEP